MATRLLRVRPAAPAAAALALYLALPKTTIYADTPPSEAAPPTRKPIYDEPAPSQSPSSFPSFPSLSSSPSQTTPETPKAPTPTDRLATQISHVRRFLLAQSARAEDSLNASLTSALRLEHNFTSTLSSLAPAPQTGERLGVGMVYVLVASMAGSILTRNRTILLRAVFPPAVALGAAWYLLPNTMRNVSGLAWEWEKKYPKVADTHLKIKEAAMQGLERAENGARQGGEWVDRSVVEVREVVEGWVRKGR